ncbi:MAG: LacI family DNA-binding transcriptional regulator [Rhodospirillales bacterium]|nr:LacI family DNA-binding transcriptional regulator [Rhodospirillales bacterium]
MTNQFAKVTLADVARAAGVSLATADRVVNRRSGVRDRTIARVNSVIARLGYRPDAAAARLSRDRSFRFLFILPEGDNTFMNHLKEQVVVTADWLAGQRAFIDMLFVDVFDPAVIGRTLEEISTTYDGIAVVAVDHPRVRAAIDDLVARGTAVVTLVSDVPGSRRYHYVGIDNPAAGRTAGTLMGRFVGNRSGKIAVVAGSLALRDHAERYFGFNQVLAREYRNLKVLAPVEGRDERARTLFETGQLLAQHPDLVGIYSVGAGNRGIAEAIEAAGKTGQIVWIAHELTIYTRRFLVRGLIDAVIAQNPGHEARSAGRVLLAQCAGDRIFPDQETIGIDIYVRDNVPAGPLVTPLGEAPTRTTYEAAMDTAAERS